MRGTHLRGAFLPMLVHDEREVAEGPRFESPSPRKKILSQITVFSSLTPCDFITVVAMTTVAYVHGLVCVSSCLSAAIAINAVTSARV